MEMTIGEVVNYLNTQIPLDLQEEYDNSGLQVGDLACPLKGVLIAVDATEEVVQEAIERDCNLIVTHHPLLLKPLKRLGTTTYIERVVRSLVKNDVALYAAHTNLDNCKGGVNYKFAKLLGLTNVQTLQPMDDFLYKLIIYTPLSAAELIRQTLLKLGVGQEGDYSGCSFSVEGDGRFRPSEHAHPYVGKAGEWHIEPEVAIYTMCIRPKLASVLAALREVHPYEEPVMDILPLRQNNREYGAGIIGDLPGDLSLEQFFSLLKSKLPVEVIRSSRPLKRAVRRVAFCGGSGAFLRTRAARLGADIFITGEAKYNDFYDATDDVTLCTIGHYESEELTKRLLHEILSPKLANFALCLSEYGQNPIKYI